MDVFVARQPIFDLKGEVAGYELLYRRTAESRYADGDDTNSMSRDVVVQSFLEVGIDRITHGKAGFINFGRQMLIEEAFELLDPQTVVIELLEDVVVDDAVVMACQKLVKGGYRLALDDFAPGGPQESLLPYAQIVKLDVLARTPDELSETIDSLKRRNFQLLAEKVETTEIHEQCKRLGFELFQGYFYSRPELVANRGVSVDQTSMIKLLSLLGNDRASDQDVEEGFRHDASLSYKLLRMLNTAAHGARGIESIRYGIRFLGRGVLQRWLSLLLASSLGRGGMASELVDTAVVRGRFCELLGANSSRLVSADALFLVGIFSLMDSLLRIPMEEVLDRIDLAEPVRTALLSREGPYADYLRVAEAYESGQWDEVNRLAPSLGIASTEIPSLYLEGVRWAREHVAKAT